MSGQGNEIADDQNENSRNESPKWTRSQIFTLVSAASLNFSSMICYSILGPFFPKEAGRKGANDTVVGMIFGCFALFNLIFSLLLGKYIVQIGAKFMFVSGMFISGCCTILFGLLDKAPDGLVFIVLCFVVRSMDAIGFSGCVTASFSILAATFPNNIATIMGLLEIFAGLGLVMGPPIGGFLYQMFGYEVPFIAVGCIALSMVPLNMGILPNYGGIASSVSFWKLLAIPKVTLVCLIVFSVSSCIGFLDPTIPLFLTQKFNLHSGYIGLVFLGFAVSYALSSPLLGYLSDNLPRIRKWLLLVGSWLIAVSFSFLGPAPIFHIKCQLWMFVLMLVFSGFSLSLSGIPVFPEIITCVYENGFEEGLGTLGLVSGIFGAWWCLGSFVGPTLGGYLYEKLGFEWAAVIQGSFPLFFVGLWDSRRRRASTTDTKLNLDILTGLNGLQLSFRQPLDILVFQIVFTNSVFTQLSYINSAICL
ncbi:MFS-type transporter SLC18B1 isoform X3 [Rhincodon typus]|uniref:MFS-type transporter SLC18B1 isoform X3 n=1 Tax=Rhincodon typus TaxID=259920 RepID=UPI00202E6CC2|nr:MFS-type transporter SLC18B1 isoform X3 [Rhincodon typus]